MSEVPKYLQCRHYIPDLFSYCGDGKGAHSCDYCAPYARTPKEQNEQMQPINVTDCETCRLFKSRYIEYPLTISGMEIKQPTVSDVAFAPVRVMLCEDNKMYFGILLGEFPQKMEVSFDEDTKMLNVSTVNNPRLKSQACENKTMVPIESY